MTQTNGCRVASATDPDEEGNVICYYCGDIKNGIIMLCGDCQKVADENKEIQ